MVVTILSMFMMGAAALVIASRMLTAATAPTIRLGSSGREPNLEKSAKHKFHAFISHSWSTGQDQVQGQLPTPFASRHFSPALVSTRLLSARSLSICPGFFRVQSSHSPLQTHAIARKLRLLSPRCTATAHSLL
jgi:hypothetical protein